MKIYTGIGSRKAPEDILELMTKIASELEKRGWICRSGGADGADLAFEKGIIKKENKEIYIPWRGFNNSDSLLYKRNDKEEECLRIARENHPGWQYLSDGGKKLMARNVCQIQGQNLDINTKFVICWTPDGCESHETRGNKTGGTGLAISIASKLNIPIFNLKNKESKERLLAFLDKK